MGVMHRYELLHCVIISQQFLVSLDISEAVEGTYVY
jgi:hypothetical protein